MPIAFEEPQSKPEPLTRVVFHIACADGLVDEINKCVPDKLAAYASIESPDIPSDRYEVTSTDNSSDKLRPTWNANLAAMRMRMDARITFHVNHLPPYSPIRLFKKPQRVVLAQTDAYKLSELYRMQDEIDTVTGNAGARSNNIVPLPLHTNSKSKKEANLYISVRKIVEGAALRQESERERVQIEKKVEAQNELQLYLSEAEQELVIAESRVGSSSTTTTVNRIHITIGALASVSPIITKHYLEENTVCIKLASAMYEAIVRLNTLDDNDIFNENLKQILLEIINVSCLLNRYLMSEEWSTQYELQISTTRFVAFQESITPSSDSRSSSGSSTGNSCNTVMSSNHAVDYEVPQSNPKLEELRHIDIRPPSTPSNNVDFSATIQKISKWIFSPKKAQPSIFYLCGPKGSGKGALITNIVQEFKDLGYMKGYFSFEPLDESDTSMLSMLIPTIAFQLGRSLPGVMRHICKALEETPTILQYDLMSQFDKLLRKPLNAFQAEKEQQHGEGYIYPVLIVLDKLDKCDSTGFEDLNSLLDLLVTELSTLPNFMHFIVVSKPQDNIDIMFGVSPSVVKHELHFLGPKNIKRPDTRGQADSTGYAKDNKLSQIKGRQPSPIHVKRISLSAKRTSTLETVIEMENPAEVSS